MDSLTQGLLGAATFAIVKDKDIGKKSLLIGALAGTIPDLDVFLAPFFNDIEFLTVHRSVSHSIGLAIVLSLLLGELFYRKYKRKQSRKSWNLAFFLAIFTHSILALKYALMFSSCYLLLGIASKNHAYYHFKGQLEMKNIAFEDILVSPTPMNIFLWHGIVKQKGGYQFSTYSIFDRKKPLNFQFVKSNNEVIEKIENNRLVKYYLDYTQGYPLIETDAQGNTKIYAIKYGPINYYGKPEFVYPLTFNLNDLSEENITIGYEGKQRGPVKNYKNLCKRILSKI